MQTFVQRFTRSMSEPLTFLKWWTYQRSRSAENNVFLITMNHAGTHWLRMLLAKSLIEIYDLNYDIENIKAYGLIPPYHRKKYRFKYNENKNIVRIQHSHARYYKIHFNNGNVLLLVRDLRDAIYSHYRSYSARNSPDMKFSEFLRGKDINTNKHYTLNSRIEFLNSWESARKDLSSVLIVHFEELKENTVDALAKIFDFIGWKAERNIIEKAIAFASRDNMMQLENLHPTRKNKGKTVKVRKGSIQSYHSEYSTQDREYFLRIVRENLKNAFGYNYEHWK